MSSIQRREVEPRGDLAMHRLGRGFDVDRSKPLGHAAPSRLVLTIGLRGSASAWLFNIVRELMTAAFGPDAVTALAAASPLALLSRSDVVGRHVVCKSHGWPGLDVLAYFCSAHVMLTVRDPRDCVVSQMERFGAPFASALSDIARDCHHVAAGAAVGHPVFRYEDRFFDRAATVRALALELGTLVGVAELDAIFARYRTEAVRAFAAAVPSLPPERLDGDGEALLLDRVTRITRSHVGDGRVGKWRERLDPPQRAEAAQAFAPFLDRFGYAVE